jgi:hypothetical protein
MTPNKSARAVLHEYFLGEGDNISQRIDWFLIFHAILLEAFFAAKGLRFKLTVLSFGLSTSILWIAIGLRQNWTMGLLRAALTMQEGGEESLREVLLGVRESQDANLPRWYRWVRAIPIFTIIIPSLTLGTWLTLLVLSTTETGVRSWEPLCVAAVPLGTVWIATMVIKHAVPPSSAQKKLSDRIKSLERTTDIFM